MGGRRADGTPGGSDPPLPLPAGMSRGPGPNCCSFCRREATCRDRRRPGCGAAQAADTPLLEARGPPLGRPVPLLALFGTRSSRYNQPHASQTRSSSGPKSVRTWRPVSCVLLVAIDRSKQIQVAKAGAPRSQRQLPGRVDWRQVSAAGGRRLAPPLCWQLQMQPLVCTSPDERPLCYERVAG